MVTLPPGVGGAVPLLSADAALGAPLQVQSGPRLRVVIGAVRDGCRYMETACGLWGLLFGVGHRMFSVD